MTDLNPTPNNRLSIGGVLGFGDLGMGLALAVGGFVADIAPLMWTGVGLAVCGIVLACATWRSSRGA